MKKLYNIFSLFFLIIIAVSCVSSKKAKTEITAAAVGSEPASSTVAVGSSGWSSGDAVTSKVNLMISAKGKEISLDGTARMKRDDVIQINLTYLFGIQVATLEMTEDGILIVDRVNHQFMRATYQNLGLGKTIGFKAVQSLFWGEAQDGNFTSFSWKTGSLTALSQGHSLPSMVTLQYVTSKETFKADFHFSSQSINSDWNTRTEVNTNKYTELQASDVIKKIMGLVK